MTNLMDSKELWFKYKVCKVIKVEAMKWDKYAYWESWAEYGCFIMMDGWNDMNKWNIIKCVFGFSCKCTIFLRAIDSSKNFLKSPIITIYIHGHI